MHLETYVRFSPEESALLNGVCSRNMRTAGARRDIIREGEKPTAVNVVLDGWACRYKQLPDGRRQIVGFFIPGDLCDAKVFILHHMDHSIGTITKVRYAAIPASEFEALMDSSPRLTLALWWHELVNAAVSREWTTNIGQRTALERIGHLLCELFVRLRAVRMTDGDSCEFPLTQYDLADATGLTSVHVNRTLQEMRRLGLVELENKVLTVPSLNTLCDASMFNPNYLHLNHEGRFFDSNR